jgi:hypothetical protein
LEHHTPDNIDQVIDYAVRHDSVFHQFMLYSPSPGTPLYHDFSRRGILKDEDEFPWADWHGQLGFSWRHPQIKDGQETEYITRAFQRDFEVNGPSVLRGMRTILNGWKRYKNHPDARIRRRLARETKGLRKKGVAAAAAAREYYRDVPALHAMMSGLLEEMYDQFGDSARHIGETAGPYALDMIRTEEKKLAEGWTYEPPTFYDINSASERLYGNVYQEADLCHYVTARPSVSEPPHQENAGSPTLTVPSDSATMTSALDSPPIR